MTVVGARVQVRVAVEPTLGRPATSGLLAAMQSYLEEFRLVGHQLEVIAPEYVPLEVVMVAWTVPGVAPDRVRNGLRRAFSASGSAAGDSGFFWPGNWELGQPVYLSDVLDRALQVEGVAWVNSSPSSDPRVRFAPVGAPFSETLHNIEQGYAPITTMQIARALSDPDDPSQGQASFFVVEGR